MSDITTGLSAIRTIVGQSGWLDDAEAMAPYFQEHRGLFHGRAAAVVSPADTDEVARVVAACAEHGIAVVPQGGNTGLCGGANPGGGGEILLSLARLNRIRAVDADNFTVTAEAGCVLADVQRAAAAADRLFPLSYAAEERCLIGGNLATNAGGMNVLKYGNARELTLGLEVVLADGRVWNGLTALRKDNSSLDLKDLFIGAEGSLGIITAAVLRLFPRPLQTATAMVALPDARSAVALLGRLRAASADALTACELMARTPVDFALAHGDGCEAPFAQAAPWYLLVDLTSSRPTDNLAGLARETLDEAHAQGLATDFIVAEDAGGAERLWRIRKSIPDAQRHEGASIKHDISVPVSRVPQFLEEAGEAVHEDDPAVRICAFGHLGDGNIHYNLSQPPGMDPNAFLARWDHYNAIVHDVVARLQGSFAAEHGIGKLKPSAVRRYKSPVEVDLLRRLKAAMDPQGIMNPGKLVP